MVAESPQPRSRVTLDFGRVQAFINRVGRAGSRLRRLIRLLASVYMRKSRLPFDHKTAIVQLTRLHLLREPFVQQILGLFRVLDYSVIYYVDRVDTLFYLARLGENVISDNKLILSAVLPDATSSCLLVCDKETGPPLSMKWKGVLHVEFDLSRSRDEFVDPLYVPFPDRSVGWLTPEIKRNRKQQKNIRVLFSGAYRGYRGHGIKGHLGKMEREEIIGVFRRFPKTRVIESRADLDSILATDADNDGFCYFVDTDKFRIPQQEWFDVLARAQVFLCPPGIVHPFCHNAVEAMAVGTIPLINYHEWFHPKLTPDVNCLAFCDEAELIAQLEFLIRTDNEKLVEIGNATQTYYDEHLDPAVFARKLEERISQEELGSKIHLVVTTEIVDYLPRLKPDSLAYAQA